MTKQEYNAVNVVKTFAQLQEVCVGGLQTGVKDLKIGPVKRADEKCHKLH